MNVKSFKISALIRCLSLSPSSTPSHIKPFLLDSGAFPKVALIDILSAFLQARAFEPMILSQRAAAAHKIAILLFAIPALNDSGGKLSNAHLKATRNQKDKKQKLMGFTTVPRLLLHRGRKFRRDQE